MKIITNTTSAIKSFLSKTSGFGTITIDDGKIDKRFGI